MINLEMINLEKCKAAMKNIYVRGLCNSAVREEVIEDAIKSIQDNGRLALSKEYMGVKNYAHFGDQRSDHEMGYGPKHGSIVFSVGRNHQRDLPELGENEVYFLLKCRDFEGYKNADGKTESLHDVIQKILVCEAAISLRQSYFDYPHPPKMSAQSLTLPC